MYKDVSERGKFILTFVHKQRQKNKQTHIESIKSCLFPPHKKGEGGGGGGEGGWCRGLMKMFWV